ncbi:MAG: glycoside hydrolase family 5 protein [Bacteroidetes bacterium]|nr:glycoside hydrolase family 5 protein [Bacteroidota bacterium]
MKKYFALTGLVFLFLADTLFSQPVKEHGALHVDGIQLKDELNNAVVLRGMSFGWHCLWPRFYNAGAVEWLHNDWGCTVIRAAMGIELPNGYKEKPEWSKEKIITVVDAAIKEGVYVIIDWHSHNINLPEAKDFFKEMATKYGNYPNVIYELFNEPDQETWPEVKAYATEVINTIRAIDKDNIILVGNPHWDQDLNTVADDPLTGFSNIMYTMHFYAATHKQWLRDRCEYAMNKGIPVFISECAGMESSGDGPIDYAEWKAYIDWAEAHQLSWITWSVSDKNETCSVLKPSASSNGHWKTADLKESGIKTREILRHYAGLE